MLFLRVLSDICFLFNRLRSSETKRVITSTIKKYKYRIRKWQCDRLQYGHTCYVMVWFRKFTPKYQKKQEWQRSRTATLKSLLYFTDFNYAFLFLIM